MQFFFVLFLFGAFAYVENAQLPEFNPVYGYIKNIGIPTAERIRNNEYSRIVGGVPAFPGLYPFQAGLLGDVVGLNAVSVCGASLISTSRALTAAHCWNDGVHQIWRLTVVLGSVRLFEGGTRIETSGVATHPNWSPSLIRNDIAVIYLPSAISVSANIAPIALPTGSEIFESFTGYRAFALGFGTTSDDGNISNDQTLSQVSLNVITNSVCSVSFPLIVQASNICTSGAGGAGPCRGDSGGPLIVNRNNKQILIGVTSFVSALGCESGLPAAYARVTSFLDFINQNL